MVREGGLFGWGATNRPAYTPSEAEGRERAQRYGGSFGGTWSGGGNRGERRGDPRTGGLY